MITTYSITQDSLVTGALTNYTLRFTPVNPLPPTGSIQIGYPQQIVLKDGPFTNCTVTTTADYQSCSISTDSQTIIIDNVFTNSTSYSG
jgi:hypothetical protein